MYDQPFTNRSIPGENHHFGLVSQQDRPYADMVAEVRKTNARLFSLHAGTTTEPFELDDFSGVLRNVPCIVRLRRKFMPGSMPGNVVCESNDNGRETLFDGNTSHLKINPEIFLSGGVNAFGTIDLSSGAVREVRATFYCYNGRKDSPGWSVFSIEADGKPAERIEATRTCEWKGRDFCRYAYSIRPPVGAERLRIGIDVRDPARSWSALLADVSTMPR